MAKYFLGNELFLFDGSTGDPMAYSTECTLSLSADTIDVANKMVGHWGAALPGTISWSISSGALYTDQNNYHDLFTKMTSRTPVPFKFGQVKDYETITDYEDPDSYVLDASAGYYQGNAYITSLELNAGNGEAASYSVELTGNGQLSYKTT